MQDLDEIINEATVFYTRKDEYLGREMMATIELLFVPSSNLSASLSKSTVIRRMP